MAKRTKGRSEFRGESDKGCNDAEGFCEKEPVKEAAGRNMAERINESIPTTQPDKAIRLFANESAHIFLRSTRGFLTILNHVQPTLGSLGGAVLAEQVPWCSARRSCCNSSKPPPCINCRPSLSSALVALLCPRVALLEPQVERRFFRGAVRYQNRFRFNF